MKSVQTILVLLVFEIAAFAQITEIAVQKGRRDVVWNKLLGSNHVIQRDDKLNEQLLDLVEVYETDSVLDKRTQRHRVFGSPFAQLFGFRWVSINMRKMKYVGTSVAEVRVPGEEKFTEYDVNFNMIPHLDRYIALAWYGFQEERRRGRDMTVEKAHHPPFIYPPNEEALKHYKMHNECTPSREYRAALDSLFYPAIKPSNMQNHPNFVDQYTSLGMYGPFVSDCNHNCHPEIHPYEWIWWMDLKDETSRRPEKQGWYVGLLRDVSNRMRNWSSSPRSGAIAVPFIFPAHENEYTIEIQHLVYDAFNAAGFAELTEVPEYAFDFRSTEKQLELRGLGKTITLKTNKRIDSEAIKWWVSDVLLDETGNLLSGRLHIALSVNDLYTARVEFSY